MEAFRVRCQLYQSVIDSLDESIAQEVRDEFPVVTKRMASALPISWCRGEDYIRLLTLVRYHLDEAEFRDLFRRVFIKISSGRLLSTLTSGYLRLYGTPAGLARGAARGWQMVGQGLGNLRVEVDDEHDTTVWFEYPADLDPENRFLPLTFAGTFDGFYELCGKADTRCVLEAKTPGIARYTLPST